MSLGELVLLVCLFVAAIGFGFWQGWSWRGEHDEDRAEEARWKEADRG